MTESEHRPDETKSVAGTRAAGPQSQSDFDLEFFGRVLERNPEYVDALRLQAELLARKGQFGKSLELDRRLARLLPNHHLVHYNLACSLAMVGKASEAVRALAEAIRLGYDDFAHLEADPDLDSLHNHPAFKALLKKHGIGP